jgi:hypothetical protein
MLDLQGFVDCEVKSKRPTAKLHVTDVTINQRKSLSCCDNTRLTKNLSVQLKGLLKMATAKKSAPKAATKAKKVTAPAKAAKPAVKVAAKKAPVSKAVQAMARIGVSIAKLTERKNKIAAEITALKDKRTALKAAPAAAAPAKAAPAAPKKAVAKKK